MTSLIFNEIENELGNITGPVLSKDIFCFRSEGHSQMSETII